VDGESPPGLKADEEEAIKAVREHARASFVGLIDFARMAVLARAKDNVGVLDKLWTRDSTIYEKGAARLPLVRAQSLEASIEVGLDHIVEGTTTTADYRLFVALWAQKKHETALATAAAGTSLRELDATVYRWFADAPPAEGSAFKDLADQLADLVWPAAKKLRELIASADKKPEQKNT
jgi:hypothetical protein